MIQLVLLLLTAGSLTAAMVRGAPFDRMILSVGVTILSVMYVALFGGHLIAVRVGFVPAFAASSIIFLSRDYGFGYGRLLWRQNVWPAQTCAQR